MRRSQPARSRSSDRPQDRHRRGDRSGGSQVYGITTARRGQRDDVHDRMVKYAVSMGIRMVCLVLAFVVEGWAAWIFVAGAVLLPYVAVLLANAGRETAPKAPPTLLSSGAAAAPVRPALEAAPSRVRPAGQWQHPYPPPGSSSRPAHDGVPRARAS